MSHCGNFFRWVVGACSLILLGCATSPTGRNQLMLVSPDTAIVASKEAYRDMMDSAAEDDKLDNDPATVERVRKITGRIIAQAIEKFPHTRQWDWQVKIIDDPEEVNAWSMAGGKMAIYTGLIEKIEPTDDELAQVMGHEAAHAIANHTAEKMSVALATQAGLLGISLAVKGKDNSDAVLIGAALAASLTIDMPNSRSAEREADEMGLELAARAGYDPHAAVTLWEKMEELDNGRLPEWLSTHPSPKNRKETLEKLATRMMRHYRTGVDHPTYSFPP